MAMKGKDTFIRFMGGRNIIFFFVTLILIGLTVIVYNKVSFIFHPFIIIISTIAPPVIMALIAFYLLNPIVNALEKIRIGRLWGIILLIIAFTGAVTGLLIITIPKIESQVLELIDNFPDYIANINDGIHAFIGNSFLGDYFEEGHQWLDKTIGDLPSKIGDNIGNAMESISGFANTITTIVISFITFPFVLFFLLKDGKQFKSYFVKLFPKRFRNDLDTILHQMDTQVGSYIQGQIFVAFCIGLLLFIGYWIIGLNYAVTLAIVAAVTSVVPYLGPMIAITPAIIIAMVTSPWMLLKLVIVWFVVQFLEGHFISPNIMGKTMKIHPLTIMFTLLIAGKIFGVIGVILAIPGYAILKVMVKYLFTKLKLRYVRFYGDEYE